MTVCREKVLQRNCYKHYDVTQIGQVPRSIFVNLSPFLSPFQALVCMAACWGDKVRFALPIKKIELTRISW